MKRNIMLFKKIVWTIILPVSLLSFQACNELDIKPTDGIDPDKAFRNLEDIDMGIKGAYAAIDYTLIENNVTVSDEAIMPAENVVSNTNAYRWLYTASSSSVTSAFREYYIVIDRTNRVLTGLEKLTNVDETKKRHYRGELLAIRAYAHLELLRAFSGGYEPANLAIPYMLESKISYPTRNTVQEVVNFVKTDLNEALSLIGDEASVSRISKPAVYAILARTALYSKDWPLAISASTSAINAKPLASQQNFARIWTDQSEDEVIWSLKKSEASDSRIGSFLFREDGGIALFAPSSKLLNLFDKDNDIRYSSYITYDPDRGAGKSPYLIKKYVGRSSDAPGLTNIKLFRTGEMYLIRAEAYAETPNQLSGTADLNQLRKSRITGYTDQTFADKETLIREIYTERYKELAYEGHRFFDLKRRNLPVQRSAQDAVNTSGALTLESGKAQYNFPIPATEMSVNKNMIQNPNYSN
ncbi:RagB/SusD family nutrient uptake outer membrane protein [Sphingobacterium spiritivorum]|nr:RagB/SusD family nutrient uptake outer membrane protein [Sphingobacterium spiritivorum]